ncbi:two-component system, NarL family, sensor histidine kinase UhpB [Janthinobacterium sp. CG_23.3]|uniref:sensor histidine kinase n=1 Tax=Janthinobacterium sp. CG_23.3 TaxID=3349634 RepID=UPI0038D41DD1
MRPVGWKNWGIGARLVLITILPVVMMFLTVVLCSYQARLSEVAEELDERGRVIATALADSAEYGVVSGNAGDLRRIVNGLVKADSDIYRIEILNAQRSARLHLATNVRRAAGDVVCEAPINKQTLAISDYSDGGPHVSGIAEGPPKVVRADVIGYVRVTMSPSSLQARQRHRLVVESIITLCVLVATVGFALYLRRILSRPLASTICAVRAIMAGHYQVQVRVTTGGEIGDLQASINAMAVGLSQSKQNLENKVQARTRDLLKSRNEALKSDAEKRKLIQKVNSAVEDERKSIAIEIHDELNATLIAARLNSQRILALATAADNSPAVEEIKERAQSTIELTSNLYASARNIVRRLRPEVLDMLGLDGAVEEMVNNYGRAGVGQFNFQCVGDVSRLDGSLAIAAYRLVQEALSNVVKHARASKTTVTLFLIEEDDNLQITIADNGAGFDAGAASQGIGLIGMRERVVGVDGCIDIASVVGRGTEITLTLPLRTEDAAAASLPDGPPHSYL